MASVFPRVIVRNLERELCQRARAETLATQTKIKQVSRAFFCGCVHTSLCPHSGYPSYLSSNLLRPQTTFLQKECSKKLWVCEEVPRNQRKTRAHRDPVPTLVPEYKLSTFYFVGCFTEA